MTLDASAARPPPPQLHRPFALRPCPHGIPRSKVTPRGSRGPRLPSGHLCTRGLCCISCWGSKRTGAGRFGTFKSVPARGLFASSGSGDLARLRAATCMLLFSPCFIEQRSSAIRLITEGPNSQVD